MNDWRSHVLPHGPLRQLAPRLWEVTGKLPRGNMPRNMAILQLGSGGLLVHSAIALDEPGMTALAALGQPEVVIVPNRFHRLDAAVWRERFPAARFVAPAAARAAVEQKVKIDATAEETLPALGVRCLAPSGVKPGELCYEVDADGKGGKALIVTDLLFNLKNVGGFDGWLFKMLGSTGFFGMTVIGRMLMLKERKVFKDWLIALAEVKPLVISVGHGDAVVGDCAARLRAAAARL